MRECLSDYSLLEDAPVPDSIDDVIDEDEQYTCIGESHGDVLVGANIILPLIASGDYDTIFLEALARGDYSEEGDELKHASDSIVYQLQPDKYDAIIQAAQDQDMAVHGIDAHGSRDGKNEVHNWAEYMREHSGDRNIALIGNLHLNHPFRDFPDSGNLPKHLMQQGEDSIVTLSTSNPDKIYEDIYRQNIGSGLHNINHLLVDRSRKDERIADFLYVRPV